MTKLFNRKTQEVQMVDSKDEAFIDMTIRIWVKFHNEQNPGNKISRKDIIVVY